MKNALIPSLAMVGLLGACGEDTSTSPAPSVDLNAEVAALIQRGCGVGAPACHGPNPSERHLDFERILASDTLWEALADVPSCQYDAWPLVAPGDPDRSWLMVKLTHEVDAARRLRFEPDPSWVPSAESCALEVAGTYDFGMRMPEVGSLTDEEIETFRAWIRVGKASGEP